MFAELIVILPVAFFCLLASLGFAVRLDCFSRFRRQHVGLIGLWVHGWWHDEGYIGVRPCISFLSLVLFRHYLARW